VPRFITAIVAKVNGYSTPTARPTYHDLKKPKFLHKDKTTRFLAGGFLTVTSDDYSSLHNCPLLQSVLT
jgi:hypothetical protein